jgi:PHD/YefM family antitoxin component YafN of YafNO toxin-antitoxin module
MPSMLITENGEAAMVIQTVADYEQTQETLALLKMLAQSQQAVSAGKTVSVDQAFQQLRQRRGLTLSERLTAPINRC